VSGDLALVIVIPIADIRALATWISAQPDPQAAATVAKTSLAEAFLSRVDGAVFNQAVRRAAAAAQHHAPEGGVVPLFRETVAN
jgi:hypothetical protein